MSAPEPTKPVGRKSSLSWTVDDPCPYKLAELFERVGYLIDGDLPGSRITSVSFSGNTLHVEVSS